MNLIEFEVCGKKMSIETGRIAKQANGSVVVRCGDTVVFVAACGATEAREGTNFFPLTVDYREKTYAAGRIPGGFFKREARPTEHETLTMRLTDRPIRPLFPDNYFKEVQVMSQVLSYDGLENPDVLSMIGASAALVISDLPLSEALGSVRVGLINEKYIINPTVEEMKESLLNLVMAGTADAIMMVEGGSDQLSEKQILEALKVGHEAIQPIVKAQNDLMQQCGKEKLPVEKVVLDEVLYSQVKDVYSTAVANAFEVHTKVGRDKALEEGQATVKEQFSDDADESRTATLKEMMYKIEKQCTRKLMFETKKRADGRSFAEIRPISTEVGILPRTHGSALFTRGETQALVTVTLGSVGDQQMIDGLDGLWKKSFFLHYNFPPFSVGECKPVRGVSRREIGHGNLAERALEIVQPDIDSFPYTVRIVSEIMESNGSSSMASVCGGSMALMDAGANVKGMVSGIAMGLIKDEDGVIVLSDILGTEDYLGDMDFKVAGTDKGITAFQMDIKIKGISFEIMQTALTQAKEGRKHILAEMAKTITVPKNKVSEYAPKVETVQVPKDKIKDIIGPGGKIIKGIIEKTGVEMNVDDDGFVTIACVDGASLAEAKSIIEGIIEEPEIGKLYNARVVKIMDFGAFVEFLPGKEGLVHISEIAQKRVESVEDELSEGQKIRVKLIDIDKMGRKSLSIKAAMEEQSS